MSAYIYQFVEKPVLDEILQAFHACVGLTIQVLDENGNPLQSCGEKSSYCQCFQKHLRPGDTCPEVHKKAASHALTIGESYIFNCHSSLSHIVFPLVVKDTLLGSILVGPFLLDAPDMIMMEEVARRYQMSITDVLELYDASTSVPVIEPTAATQISRLLYHLSSNFISDSRERLLVNQGKLRQQSRINESIQHYKAVDGIKTIHYPFEKERLLIQKVRTGNLVEARGILNDLLGYVLFSGGSILSHAKTRSMELCSLLSRTAIEGGAGEAQILALSDRFLQNINRIDTLDELCFRLQELVEVFTASTFPDNPDMNNDAVRKAIIFIGQNFSAHLTLEHVARHVYLNPSYFSSIFKQATGVSFKEYVTKVRLSEAKRLLTDTDYPILDIALACGFDSQSYFSKVFKKYTGLSPKQFRS